MEDRVALRGTRQAAKNQHMEQTLLTRCQGTKIGIFPPLARHLKHQHPSQGAKGSNGQKKSTQRL